MMTRTFTKLSLYAVCLCSSLGALAQTTITNNGGKLSVQYNNDKAVENFQNLNDNDVNTKYYIAQTDIWIQYESVSTAILTQYAITSANDANTRDPKDWQLLGSKDGSHWDTLDSKTAQTFAARFQTNTYTLTGATGYLYFRLHISANNGAAAIQLSEWKLTGSAAGPAAPTQLTASISGYNAQLHWTDNSTDETGFVVSGSTDGVNFQTLDTVSANVHQYADSGLNAGASYVYHVRTISNAGVSAFATSGIVKTAAAPTATDLTNYIGGIVSDQYNTTGAEGIAKAVDNSIYTKYLAYHNTTWVTYHLANPGIATQYAITSGNDAAGRDPKNWQFQGSNDSTTWTTLHVQSNQTFNSRQQKRTFLISNSTPYTYYRLNVTANNGDALIQFAELEIYGTGSGTMPSGIPAAPSGLAARAVSGDQIELDWFDNATTETSYRLERSADSINWDISKVLNPNSTRFFSIELTPLTSYYYRLRAENSNGNSAWVYAKNTTLSATPPATWKEHWFEHDELLSLFYSNSSVNIYYDSAVPHTVTWMNEDMSKVWEYTKANYGTFSETKVNMVYHSISGYSGGHPATVFDSTHDWRNVADLGGEWTTRSAWNVGASIHEVGHIVEGGSKGVKGSPAFAIWHDSKWMEIYIYDVTKRLGWTADAEQTYNDVIGGVENYPKPGTHWFRDWFYPIYTKADSSAALNRFFVLLSEYFPQHNGEYTRDLNLGEFVHFWSGAAGFSLKNQADTAFKWDEQLEMQFKQAQIDFPFTYPDALAAPAPLDTTKLPTCRVWPNPASGYINVSLPGKTAKYIVSLYGINGVKHTSRMAQGNNIALNVSNLPNGMYIVTVADEHLRIVSRQKVIVSNSNTATK